MKPKAATVLKYTWLLLFLICVFQKPQTASAYTVGTECTVDNFSEQISTYDNWILVYDNSVNVGFLFTATTTDGSIEMVVNTTADNKLSYSILNDKFLRWATFSTDSSEFIGGDTLTFGFSIDTTYFGYHGQNTILTVDGEKYQDNEIVVPTPQVMQINVNNIPYNGTAEDVIEFFDLDIFEATPDDRWLFIYIDRANKGYYFKVLNDNVNRTLKLRDNGTHVDITGMYEYNIYFYGLGSCTSTSTTSSINVDNGCSADTKYYYYSNCDNVTIGATLLPYVVFIDDSDENKPDENEPTPTPTPTPLPPNFMLNTAESNDKGFTLEKAFSVEAIQDVWNEKFLTVPADDIENYVVYEIDSEHYAEDDRGVYLFLYEKSTVLYVERDAWKNAVVSNGYFDGAGNYSPQFGYRLKWNYGSEKWEYVSGVASSVSAGTIDDTASFGNVYASNQSIYEMETSYTIDGVKYYLGRKVYNADGDEYAPIVPSTPTPTESPVASIDVNDAGLADIFDAVMQIMNIPFSINGYEVTFLQIFIYIVLSTGVLYLIFGGTRD